MLPSVLPKVLSAIQSRGATKNSPANFRGLHGILKNIIRIKRAGKVMHYIGAELNNIINILRGYLSLIFKDGKDVDPATIAHALRTQGEILRCFQAICSCSTFFHRVLDNLSQANESIDRCVSCLVLRHLITFESEKFTDKDGAICKAVKLPVKIIEEATDQPTSRAELCRLIVAMGQSDVLSRSHSGSALVAFVIEHATLSNREVEGLEDSRKLFYSGALMFIIPFLHVNTCKCPQGLPTEVGLSKMMKEKNFRSYETRLFTLLEFYAKRDTRVQSF